jgi:putative ABC transport system permease protein
LFKQSLIKAFLVRFCFTAKMAANGILSNVLRSALTVLGVAIGVASVVGLMGIGEGARLNVMEQFESLGTNVIAIKAHDENYEFQPDKAGELVQRVESLEMATPVVSTDTTMRWRRTTGSVDPYTYVSPCYCTGSINRSLSLYLHRFKQLFVYIKPAP